MHSILYRVEPCAEYVCDSLNTNINEPNYDQIYLRNVNVYHNNWTIFGNDSSP